MSTKFGGGGVDVRIFQRSRKRLVPCPRTCLIEMEVSGFWFAWTRVFLEEGGLWHTTHFRNKKQCSRQLQCEVPCRQMSLILPCPPCLPQGGFGGRGVWGQGGLGRGVEGEGGRGHFICFAYCTTTWCFSLKGLRTMNVAPQ